MDLVTNGQSHGNLMDLLRENLGTVSETQPGSFLFHEVKRFNFAGTK